jgi:hypothetical protein
MFSSPSRLSLLLGTAVLGDVAAAVCTNWTQGRVLVDGTNGFANTYSIPVDSVVCSANATKDCYFTRQDYEVTDKRDLFVTVNMDPLGLSDEETDAIFKLAQDGFNNEVTQQREFITRNGTVTTTTLSESSRILQAKPGKNVTLFWTSYHLYSTGTLSGCSNETLNNMTVTATAPYLAQDEDQNNKTVLAGSWGSVANSIVNSSSHGTSGDDKNRAVSLYTSTGSMVGMLMMVLGFVTL